MLLLIRSCRKIFWFWTFSKKVVMLFGIGIALMRNEQRLFVVDTSTRSLLTDYEWKIRSDHQDG